MIEHVFSPEMMHEREKQLILALLDCAGVFYDINFTRDRILGNPIQIVDGVKYPILEQIGKEKNCTYSEIIDYWVPLMPENEREGFVRFSSIEQVKARYAAGERVIAHRFWTYDVMGNPMLAEQKIRLYEDVTTGDLLGLVYVSNGGERESMKLKEETLTAQYVEASGRADFLASMSATIPGGYHRCGVGGGFPLEFVSDSFLEIVGCTREQLSTLYDNKFFNIVAPEDRDLFMAHEPALVRDGRVNVVYRIICPDGTCRWVQDSTMHIERDGQEYYQCILADITEHIHSIDEARKRAEASNLAKSTFLFNASHDIRTPMNAIKGFAHIIEQNASDPAVVADTVRKINQASDTLMTLMNDILDLARIERGKEEVNVETVHLRDFARNLYEMFAESMAELGIDFRLEHEVVHSSILCDPLKMTRIAMNMLSNAKKFTPAGGTVTFGAVELSSTEDSATYRFFVRDTGIGMSREFQKRAFEQFERERTSTESRVSGSGLGLAIIKRLVELMGGTVSIESELGQGTEISATITLPLHKQLEEPIKAIETIAQLDLCGRHVLLVEDNEFNREIARYMLEGMHCTVDEAENGAVCVKKLMEASAVYDLILMDIQMPVMDGYRATLEIRAMEDERIAAIPIIAMTANAFDEDRRRCREVGMNAHIGKPIEPQQLLETIHAVFNNEQ